MKDEFVPAPPRGLTPAKHKCRQPNRRPRERRHRWTGYYPSLEFGDRWRCGECGQWWVWGCYADENHDYPYWGRADPKL